MRASTSSSRKRGIPTRNGTGAPNTAASIRASTRTTNRGSAIRWTRVNRERMVTDFQTLPNKWDQALDLLPVTFVFDSEVLKQNALFQLRLVSPRGQHENKRDQSADFSECDAGA